MKSLKLHQKSTNLSSCKIGDVSQLQSFMHIVENFHPLGSKKVLYFYPTPNNQCQKSFDCCKSAKKLIFKSRKSGLFERNDYFRVHKMYKKKSNCARSFRKPTSKMTFQMIEKMTKNRPFFPKWKTQNYSNFWMFSIIYQLATTFLLCSGYSQFMYL